jgi:hypothetical protein
MAISRSSAERLCTGSELELVKASAPSHAKQLSPARLQQKIERARKLRDKYRSLARQQRGEARGKRNARSTRPARGNENTQRKAQLFDETLERFQAARSAVAGSAGSVGAGAKKAGAKKVGAKKAGAKKAGAKKAGAKKAGAKKAGAKKAGAKKAGAKKAGAKKAGAKKAGARKAGAKKAGAKKASPAGGAARPAAPGRPGAAALKGARQRPGGPATTRKKSARAHNRASNQRSQTGRDRR